jgi:serralysin
MRRWTAEANLSFVVTQNRLASDVRVKFEPGGSWSYLGTDNLGTPGDEPTMQLGWLLDNPDNEDEWRRVCVHESGHMLGFGHEQAHPRGEIDWNKLVVYGWYAGPPNLRSEAEVDAQVFRKYSAFPVTNFSDYDRLSIMHYAIPEAFVLDPSDAVGWNTSRSPTDRRYAALWYPKDRTQQVITQLLEDLARAAETQLTGDRQAGTT